MCDPVSLTIAATAVAATGQVMQGIQAKKQGAYEAGVERQNAALTIQQQQDAEQRHKQEAIQLGRKQAQISGQQQVALAANGIDANFGSAARLSTDTAMINAEDRDALAHNQNSELRGFDISAANYRAKAQGAKMRGNAAFTNSLFQATGTVLGGATQYSRLKSPAAWSTT